MKKILSMMVAAIMVLSTVLCFPVSVYAESLYIRKIVSVVYDDSGSMEGNKWAYANYATQAFCGMLNSEDQLFITYMSHSQISSNYNPEKISLSVDGIQNSVDSIRKHTDSGSTPYTAVETAYNKLKSVDDSNPNTQYWLVIITDGAFDECVDMSVKESKRFLNDQFEDYIESKMPNGTTPQITFLGIGDVVSPDEDLTKGIYTYSASSADEISGEMSKMADRVSGRTRLQNKDVKQVDSKTLQISSSIPLLNIAALVQKSNAKITEAVYSNEIDIPISRKVSLSYPNYSDLIGGAYILGDYQKVIGAGTYNIIFDQDIDAEDVVFLFEPALEMRMTILLNGKEITDLDELDSAMEGDKVSVSCKIYEIGTDTEIDPSLMPPGTKFEVNITEDGKTVQNVSGEDMSLSDYILKKLETEITASVIIDGFNPIDYSVKFKPMEYVPQVVYTMTADYGGNVRSVRYDNISANKDLSICFTVYADGIELTDPNAVKALNPVISVSPQGNDGVISYSGDGKIVFTPNTASTATADEDSFDVDVTCTLKDGTTAKATYTVLIAEYEIITIDATETIKKTGFFENQVGVSFYITKDGVKLDKKEVENRISILLNEQHSELKTTVVVSNDGTITVTPYIEEEHELTFWSWWINWAYYFGLEGDDVVVTLNHSFGTADSTIDVIEEDVSYQILNVYTPLIIEIALTLFVIWWIYAICAKPRFLPGAVLYIADLTYGGKRGNRYHEVGIINTVNLKQYNALKYRLSPNLKSKQHFVGKNLVISAGYDGSVICHNTVWFKGEITPKNRIFDDLSHPQYVKSYVDDNGCLKIQQINVYNGDDVHAQEETIDNPNPEVYYVHTDMSKIALVDGFRVIEQGTIFAYATTLNE